LNEKVEFHYDDVGYDPHACSGDLNKVVNVIGRSSFENYARFSKVQIAAFYNWHILFLF